MTRLRHVRFVETVGDRVGLLTPSGTLVVRGIITAIAITPDNRWLITGSDDGYLERWSLPDLTRHDRHIFTGEYPRITGVAALPGGEQVAISRDVAGEPEIWDLWPTFRLRTALPRPTRDPWLSAGPLVVSAPRGWLAQADYGRLVIWDLARAEVVYAVQHHDRFILDLAAAPDGQACVAGSADGTLSSWTVGQGDWRAWRDPAVAAVAVVAWSPDGTRIVSMGSHPARTPTNPLAGQLTVWDAQTHHRMQHVVYTGATPACAAWHPTAPLLAMGDGQTGQILLWDTQTWTVAAVVQATPTAIGHLAWTRDGAYLVSAGLGMMSRAGAVVHPDGLDLWAFDDL